MAMSKSGWVRVDKTRVDVREDIECAWGIQRVEDSLRMRARHLCGTLEAHERSKRTRSPHHVPHFPARRKKPCRFGAGVHIGAVCGDEEGWQLRGLQAAAACRMPRRQGEGSRAELVVASHAEERITYRICPLGGQRSVYSSTAARQRTA